MSMLSQFEARSFVESLVPLGIAEVGSSRWMQQLEVWQKLNAQMHQEAIYKHDEFIMEEFLMAQKIPVLINELLVIEAWNESVLPIILPNLDAMSSIKAYMLIYHESTLANMLQILFYHENCITSVTDMIVELTDYCHRKLSMVNSGKFNGDPDPSANKLIGESVVENLERQKHDVDRSIGEVALSILRFISDHIDKVPLAVTTRLVNAQDIVLSLVKLLDESPFCRRNGAKLEKFSDQRWSEVEPSNNLKLTKLEAQIWITIYNLVMNPICRKKYHINAFRKECILKLRRFFNEVLTDQLPMLEELWRTIEQLSFMEPAPIDDSQGTFLLEQVAEIREQLRRENFRSIAEHQFATIFVKDAMKKQMHKFAAMFDIDDLDMDAPKCALCGKPAEKRCSKCKLEWFCSRECQVDAWPKHRTICNAIVKDGSK